MKGDINSRGKHDYIISEIYHIYYLDCIYQLPISSSRNCVVTDTDTKTL